VSAQIWHGIEGDWCPTCGVSPEEACRTKGGGTVPDHRARVKQLLELEEQQRRKRNLDTPQEETPLPS